MADHIAESPRVIVDALAYIGNASARVHEEHRGSCSRRFRLGDEKEAAGAADAVIYQGPMDFE